MIVNKEIGAQRPLLVTQGEDKHIPNKAHRDIRNTISI